MIEGNDRQDNDFVKEWYKGLLTSGCPYEVKDKFLKGNEFLCEEDDDMKYDEISDSYYSV